MKLRSSKLTGYLLRWINAATSIKSKCPSYLNRSVMKIEFRPSSGSKKLIYFESAAPSSEHGFTRLEMTISPEGYSRDIWVADSSHKKFSRASVKAAERVLFERPPQGKPVYRHRTAYTYSLLHNKCENRRELSACDC